MPRRSAAQATLRPTPGLAGLGLVITLAGIGHAAAQATPGAPIARNLADQGVAQTGEAPTLRIELNRLEPRDAGCRLWLVLGNQGMGAIDPLRLDLVMFGRDGVITRRLAVDVGPLPADKTSARTFDAAGLPCAEIGSVLLNDILVCGAAVESRQACLSRVAVSSRAAGVPLEK